MNNHDRITYFVLGCIIGFIVGYFARAMREVREKLEEVDNHVTHKEPAKDDGFVIFSDKVKNALLLIVVVIVAVSAFNSQHNSNKVADAQKRSSDAQASVKQTSECNKESQAKTVAALNARTQYSSDQAKANVDLQRAQSVYLNVVATRPPASDLVKSQALQTYIKVLRNYLTIGDKTVQAIAQNPYPTSEEFETCLHRKPSK